MIEQDTIKLLRECDAGAKMGVASIGDVLGYVKSDSLKQLLSNSKNAHESIGEEIRGHLNRFHDEGKDPNPVSETMSHMMSDMKLVMHKSDHTVADLMTDGCNMGVKSLSRYLNEYAAADEVSKNIAQKLIALEERLGQDMRLCSKFDELSIAEFDVATPEHMGMRVRDNCAEENIK